MQREAEGKGHCVGQFPDFRQVKLQVFSVTFLFLHITPHPSPQQ